MGPGFVQSPPTVSDWASPVGQAQSDNERRGPLPAECRVVSGTGSRRRKVFAFLTNGREPGTRGMEANFSLLAVSRRLGGKTRCLGRNHRLIQKGPFPFPSPVYAALLIFLFSFPYEPPLSQQPSHSFACRSGFSPTLLYSTSQLSTSENLEDLLSPRLSTLSRPASSK